MNISRKPPFPLELSLSGFTGPDYLVTIMNDYSADLYEVEASPDIDDVITIDLPDYFSRYDAEYRLEVYELISYPDPRELGDLVYIDTLTIQRPYVDPALLAKSPEEVVDAAEYEALARAIIDTITGGFKYEREIIEINGFGADYLPSSLRLNKVVRVYENDVCVYDAESIDPEWTNAKEYRISPDRTAVTVAVSGIGGYNRYQSRPIRIHNPQSDSFTPYNLDTGGKGEPWTDENYAFFPKGWDYVLVVDAGWPVIPNDIQTATKMLYNDLTCNTLPYLNSYIKDYKSAQFELKFAEGAFAATGNATVDLILSNYPRILSRIGVL